ncbi:MAG: DUF2147 domain-containing protein [Pseudomonadota bacterium]
MIRLIASVIVVFGMPTVALGESPVGLWQTQPGKSGGFLHIKISNCGQSFCGTIETAFDSTGTPAPAYEHLGKQMLVGLNDVGNGEFVDGTIWDPESEKTFKSKMTYQNGDLEVFGCKGPICRGNKWQRVR